MSAIIIRGDLSARRPGGERTRKPVRLPAERQRLGAMSIFKHAGRRFVRRDLGADAFARVQGFGGRQATTGHRSPISFLGSARVQACQQTPRCIADFLHNQAPSAGELHEHLATGASACPNQGGAYLHPNGATP